MLHVVLMSNQQIAMGTVAACLVEKEEIRWINMNDQWQLSLVHLTVALRTPRKPHILIGIEKEAILGWLFAKLCHGLLFLIGHGSFLLLDERDGLLELTVLKRVVQRDHSFGYMPFLSNSSFNARRLLLPFRRFVTYACHSDSRPCFW